ncbi:ATP phosphoribosyltransferase [uncultured Micrococcus sp.]|uniref:ATP phosphoribosyltransferase n=1 Tax=uncultured Micrococcus sp. TaxID=114051 RepID=UPI00259714D7|nr:ATP phosphoribosyltransferase [uncultured Micrococcus sp.]
MLRIAVPNKGALSELAIQMLREAGYRQRRDARELVLVDPENHVEFFYLRPRDIAVYVGQGSLDVGLTGRDLFADARVDDSAEEIMALGFAKSTFRLAAPVGAFTDAEQLRGRRIATTYDGLLADHLARTGLDAKIVHLDGAVESAVSLGVADAIADVVETGNTLRAAGMETFGAPIMESEAVMIGRRRPDRDRPAGLDVLLRRLQGVLVARRWAMIDYDVRRDLLERATAATPGLESPTVSPLRDESMVAVRSMVPIEDVHRVMDELYEIGARAILVSEIHAIRL